VIQAASGFFTWMVVLNDYGYGPVHLPGNGAKDNWGKQVMYAKLMGGAWCNAGLNEHKRCAIAPANACRMVSSQYAVDPAVRSLGKYMNPKIETDQNQLKECSPNNPTGWFAMPEGKPDGIFNCDPNMKVEAHTAACRDGADLTGDLNTNKCMPFAWYKINCYGYDRHMPTAWNGPYALWDSGAVGTESFRGQVVDMRHGLMNFKTSDKKSPKLAFGKLAHSTHSYDTDLPKGGRLYGDRKHYSTTAQSHAAATEAGYVPYYPMKSRMSPFFKQSYFYWRTDRSDNVGVTGMGVTDKTLYYNYQETVTRFVSMDATDYTDPAKITGSTDWNFAAAVTAFEDQCKNSATYPKSCSTAKPSLTGAANYFVKSCKAMPKAGNATHFDWTTTDFGGNVGGKIFKETYVTPIFNAKDNGACGQSTYIGHKEVENAGYQTGLNYPFIMTYTKTSGPIVLDDSAAKAGEKAKDMISDTTPPIGMDAANSASNLIAGVAANIFSRMSQMQALKHAQGAFWMCIVVVQWADLLICKTRWLSIASQGMSNSTMNFGLFFETLLAAWLAYYPMFNLAVGTRNIRVVHWFPAMPFSLLILSYDEVRKFLMRATSPVSVDKSTGKVVRHQGWLERNTYY